jgi:4-hydroxybenzoate polyprenyltransferase
MRLLSATAQTAAGRRVLAPLARSLRVDQWPKNVIVFAAFVFSAGSAWQPDDATTWWPLLWRTLALFAAWCAVASAGYLLNDVRDREADRLHPRKRARPIAAGELASGLALAVAALLAAGGIAAAFALDAMAGVAVALYAAIMAAYSLGLKRVAVLDMLILAAGVVARAASGAAALDVQVSPWLYVCTSVAAFFFAASKRWAEFRQLGPEAARHRPSLAGYSAELLNQTVVVSAAAALVSYAVYTVESANVPANGAMALTLPFVAFGLFRYLLLLDGARRGDAPDRIIFTDPGILAAILGFAATALVVLLW